MAVLSAPTPARASPHPHRLQQIIYQLNARRREEDIPNYLRGCMSANRHESRVLLIDTMPYSAWYSELSINHMFCPGGVLYRSPVAQITAAASLCKALPSI